jgi:pimeloyl-ACP methyl ester carboxylesterase
MPKILLIHGAWHGAWCWKKLMPELNALGHECLAIDLPGHGEDETPLQEVSLELYADRVVDELAKFNEKIIVLGHSMGGMVISAAAEKCPEKIEALIYLTAMLPRNHESLFMLEERNPKPSVPPNIIPSEDEVSATVTQDEIKDLFYHDCDDSDISFAIEHLSPQALAPLAVPVSLTKANFGSIPRYYIECSDDRAICLELQQDMQSKSPCTKNVCIPSSHSPFFSMPEQLAKAISGFC